jgi:hypothetical protein
MAGAISAEWGLNEFGGDMWARLKNKTAGEQGGFDLTSSAGTFPAALLL